MPEPTILLGAKALQLELLGEKRNLISRATGLLLEDPDGPHLYTCWHVVTGVDFFAPHPKEPPARRSYVVVHFQDVQERQPGVQAIGNRNNLEFPLYNEEGNPRWLQEPQARQQDDLLALGLTVPKFVDLVRLPISLPPLVSSVAAFKDEDVSKQLWGAGSNAMIVGYPHGYSAMGDRSPQPIFLKRGVASNMTSNPGMTLLDGTGAQGMSGAPILTLEGDKWRLIGVYSGLLYPDHQHGPNRRENDRFAALGTMVPISVARAFMQVPGLFS